MEHMVLPDFRELLHPEGGVRGPDDEWDFQLLAGGHRVRNAVHVQVVFAEGFAMVRDEQDAAPAPVSRTMSITEWTIQSV